MNIPKSEEARSRSNAIEGQLYNDRIQTEQSYFERNIDQAISKGHKSTSIRGSILEETKNMLESLGYKVEYNNHADCNTTTVYW